MTVGGLLPNSPTYTSIHQTTQNNNLEGNWNLKCNTSIPTPLPFPPPHRRQIATRKIGIAVDLSDESAYTVTLALHHHIRKGDTVLLLHVCTTTHDTTTANNDEATKMTNYFHVYTISKVIDFAKPLLQSKIPYNVHIVMDRKIKERLCVEINGLNLSALIVGSHGSIGEYCVRNCVCHVVFVGYSDEKDADAESEDVISTANSVVGNFAAEISTASSVLPPAKETYVEEINDILRKHNEGLLSRGDFNKLFDRVFDQIVEEELMDNTSEELLMSLRLENERRRQCLTSTRCKRTKRRHT